MKLTINKKEFLLSGAVRWSKIPQYAPQVRTTGNQLRSDRTPIPEWAPSDLSSGAGRKYWRADRNQFAFATAHTLWGGQVTLPLLPSVATLTGMPGPGVIPRMERYLFQNNQLLSFFVYDAGNGADIYCCVWNGVSWTYLSIVGTITYAHDVLYSVLRVGNLIWALFKRTNGGTWYSQSADNGATWTADVELTATITPPSTAAVSEDAIIYIGCKNSAGRLILVKSVSPYTSYTVAATGPHAPGATGTSAFINSAGTITIYVACAEGVFSWVVGAAATLVPVINLQGVSNVVNGKGMTPWGGKLMVPTKDGGLLAYDPDTGLVTPVGIDSGEGFPTDYLGNITALYADRYLLLAAVQATKSGIYAYDGAGWHTLWTTPSSVEILSLGVAGTTSPSILFSPAANDYRYLQNYHTDPLEITGAKYEASGFIDYPIYGGDMPEQLANYYYLAAYARSLVPDNEELEFWLAINEESLKPVGIINEQGQRLWIPAELSRAYTAQLRVYLRRGATNTRTPVLHYPILGTIKAGQTPISLSCDVDLMGTGVAWGATAEKALDQLESWMRDGTLLEVQWGVRRIRMDLQGLVVRETDGGVSAQLSLVQV